MSAAGDLTILENVRISPAGGVLTSNVTTTFSLTYLDLTWLLAHPIHRLCFYSFPHLSKSHFTQTILPNLKHSLSITLKHFFLLSGNLIIFPFNHSNELPKIPEIRFVDGLDSVCVTVAAANTNISFASNNHFCQADRVHPLVPRLGDIVKDSDHTKVPVLAIQITLFENHGICIGVTNHHAACDGKGVASFIKAWASITKFGNDSHLLDSENLPFLDRSVIKDSNGLETPRWNEISRTRIYECQPKHLSSDTSNGKVRATFILTRDQIKNVKESILAQERRFPHLSSFTIACGLVWSCMTKSRNIAVGMYKMRDGDDREQFVCSADCRSRLDPPVPNNYFGNCLVPCIVQTTREKIVGEDGVVKAIELVGEAIYKRFYSKESLFEGAETWAKDIVFGPATSLVKAFNISPRDIIVVQ